ncbi:hypothetical protein Gogos_019848 [Gossypium gossypioides]|uniref:Aminotransferase-like plant mobile domain-containing protein n=1 Tax=Gossypium gossypioides TaxID=34282 RepID=A0A7J9D6E4_GOSGO|nr:hypothetical protein [Gossypium gossypioides]
MVASLIRFDDKHIFAAQLAMPDDCVLKGFIHNMGKPTIPKIRGHLQVAGFLHASCMSWGYKLDLQLISVLTVDGSVITGFAIISGKVSIYQSLLGKVPDKFEGGWISMNWLKDNFNELLEDRTDEVIQQYARAYIMRLIRGILMPDRFQSLVHVRWLLHLVDFNDCGKLNVRRKGAVGSVRIGGNARNKSGIAVFWVKIMNFVAIAIPERVVQCGHAKEGQHLLVGVARRAHRVMGLRRVGKFGRRGHVDRLNILGGDAIARRDVNVEPRVGIDADISTTTYASTHAAVDSDVRTTQQSTMEEDDGGADPKDTIAQEAMLATYSGNDDE